jgi:hypothetical protein
MWLEATLSNGRQLLVDPTWSDVLPLRETYERRRDRREVPRETEGPSPGGYSNFLVFDQIRRDAAA